MISAQIIKDSINPASVRLTTAIWIYPKYFHGEIMTHRALSKNASSSRAIPTTKMLDWVASEPAMPLTWPKNQSGMQAVEELSEPEQLACENEIFRMRRECMIGVRALNSWGLHKQNANRYLEPWLHMTTLISGTDWANFFALRVHKMAQPEFQRLAYLMLKGYVASEPEPLAEGQWHLPFSEHLPDDLVDIGSALRICSGRCARVSYKNQDGNYSTDDDTRIHDRLVAQVPGHWTPLEHCAMARSDNGYKCLVTGTTSNFRGWTQYRKTFPARENVMEMDYAQHLRDYEASIS